MTSSIYACPTCQSPSIEYDRAGLVLPNQKTTRKATCGDCGWKGLLSDTVGFATTEKVWTIEAVADFLMNNVTKASAGVLYQSLEFVGILPTELNDEGLVVKNKEGVVAHNQIVTELRSQVMKDAMAGFITAAFESAEKAHHVYCEHVGIKPQGIFAEEPSDTET